MEHGLHESHGYSLYGFLFGHTESTELKIGAYGEPTVTHSVAERKSQNTDICQPIRLKGWGTRIARITRIAQIRLKFLKS